MAAVSLTVHLSAMASVYPGIALTPPVYCVHGDVTLLVITTTVPGANSMWHHDGNHNLIWWKIVLHLFIDWSQPRCALPQCNPSVRGTQPHAWGLQSRKFHTLTKMLQTWAEHWNNHKIALQGHRATPLQMWMESQLLHGAQGLEHLASDDPALHHSSLPVFPTWASTDDMLRNLQARQRVQIGVQEGSVVLSRHSYARLADSTIQFGFSQLYRKVIGLHLDICQCILISPPTGEGVYFCFSVDYAIGGRVHLRATLEGFHAAAALLLTWRTCTDAKLKPLYELPRLSDFIPWDDSSAIRGPGMWQPLQFAQFREACLPIIRAAEDGTWDESHKNLILTNAHYLHMFLEHVQALPLVFERLCLCMAEMQHLALELQAIMDYILVYRPRMAGLAERPNEEGTGGAESLVRIDSVEPIQELHHLNVPSSSCQLAIRSIHVGAATDEEKYKAIERFTRLHLNAPNPFNLVQPQKAVEPEPAPLIADQVRYCPYKHPDLSRQGKQKSTSLLPTGAVKKFDMVHYPLLLLLVDTWLHGLLSVNADKSCPPCAAFGYALPRPNLFVTIKSAEKLNLMITSWLRLRQGLLARLQVHFSPEVKNHQMWQTILQMDWLHPQTGASGTRGEQSRRDQVIAFLDGCHAELTVDTTLSTEGCWGHKTSSALGNDDVWEILWELAETNFRLEFSALDQKLFQKTDAQHCKLVGQCFPYGQWNLLHCVDLGSMNWGLVHSNWMQHAPYVFSMCRCMQDWRGCPPLLSSDKSKYSEADVVQIEKDMASFYCETFFMTFGQAPILPRRLPRTPLVPFIPEARKLYFAQESGYILDVMKWE
ncbi:uncharacterized protein EV420DRAFT_1485393 [Desarmillaria tabescens]|uniref:Uncharacterized protein n=1 Tax=Armillaria tabescens TaxID=1929756 RepID=A0AA39JGB4_ARMTA|nr:uncharacterized protein EV420DRAFT_1485393 [Desarmillaria tabescens]KAK0442270.1 hypothetical protein EV420DRAFT_1485393 [Desarmillaria tabescens]